MSKPRITTDESLADLFFTELGVDKDDEAMEIFRGSSIDTYGAPTPRAKEYMMSEEWDEKDNISIKLILDENCRGHIGVTSAGPGGADRFLKQSTMCYCHSSKVSSQDSKQSLVYSSWLSICFWSSFFPKTSFYVFRWSCFQVI
jgi:hypothetical protein